MTTAAKLRTTALYLTVIAVWGTTWIAMRAAVDTVPAITASGLRLLFAFPLLALIVARKPAIPLRYPPGHRRLMALVTIGYFTVPFVLMNVGSGAVPSGLAAVLFASVAIFIVVLSVPVLGTRIGWRQGAGIGVALAALVALIARQVGLDGATDPLGALALVTAALMHATVYVLVKRDGGAISPLTLNTLPMGIAALLLCATGFAVERPDLGAITHQSLLALLYLGPVASVAGFLAYFQLVRRLGPVPLSLVFIFFPVAAQVAAVLAGERAMGAASLGLLGIVLAASLVALTGTPRPRAASAPRPRASARALAVR